MTECRPHWDDDLIEAVRFVYNLQMHYADEKEALESIYDVIAAVEDWHMERRTQLGGVGWLLSSHASQGAAIQRVRELLSGTRSVVSVREVLQALDGDA